MHTTWGGGSSATFSIGEPASASCTTRTTSLGANRKSTLNHTDIRCGAGLPSRLPRMVIAPARSCALGTMMVDQSRVSSTVWRQRTARTRPVLPFSSWTQSPSRIEPSSWSATPPTTLPSVLCSEIASTALTTAPDTSAPVGLTPWRDRMVSVTTT